MVLRTESHRVKAFASYIIQVASHSMNEGDDYDGDDGGGGDSDDYMMMVMM